ncbi:hypothetical protein TNCT_219551 [Trichonephila clavata]|uniref:Uncharacterized protein n=1 Tax=Trichonephila clavata TaxID=2740835 RepID=A0A8X6LVH0_TRICU|nr:hypothetical protein TNCT_219551 [Trichonephila clavata]
MKVRLKESIQCQFCKSSLVSKPKRVASFDLCSNQELRRDSLQLERTAECAFACWNSGNGVKAQGERLNGNPESMIHLL